jgi:hypothetical protein
MPTSCFLAGNLFPSRCDAIGGLAEPGGSLFYTWKKNSHEPHVDYQKNSEGFSLSTIPFSLLEELHARFLTSYPEGAILEII